MNRKNGGRMRKNAGRIALVAFFAIAVFLLAACTSAETGENNFNLWGMFVQLMASAVEALFNLVKDWGVAIIIFTIIFRAILLPLMFKQTKSTYMMQKIQPELQSIQERFADDPRRQQEEMQRLYAEAKYNPLAGCLPMLLQMPIFIALFQALRNIQDFVTYKGDFTFLTLVPDLLKTPSESLSLGVGTFIPYLILMLVFAGATFLPMVLMNNSAQQKNQTLIMAVVMTIFMLWIGWSSPAGVLLYWGVSSLLGLLQSTLARRYYKSKDEAREAEQIEVKPIKVDVERKVKKKRPKKKH